MAPIETSEGPGFPRGCGRLRYLVEHPSVESAEALRRMTAAEPEDANLHAALGMVLADLGDLGAALEALDEAHYLRPESVFILYNYGLALERAGRFPEARRRYAAALRLKPGSARVEERLEALKRRPEPPAPRLPVPPPPIPDPTPTAIAPPEPFVPEAEPDREELDALLEELVRAGEPERLRAPVLERFLPGAPVSREWEPEAVPGFLTLGRSVLMLWFQQPLLWLVLPAVTVVPAAFLAPAGGGWLPALAWAAAFALSAAPLLAALTGQALQGEPVPEPYARTFSRWLRLIPPVASLVGAAVVPFSVFLSLRVTWEAWVVLPAMLALTLPFHALLAPALVRIVLGDLAPGAALRRTLKSGGRRLWLHLGLMAGFAVLLGGLLAFMAVVAEESTRGLGQAVTRSLAAGAVCLVASFWGALMIVCGLDADFPATDQAASDAAAGPVGD